MLAKKALSATAGAPKVFVEDVMSCFLYTGNGSTQTITNNIDLSGEGGLVWWKNRTNATGHGLIDTVRGIDYYLSSNTTDAQDGPVSYISSVSSTGYTIGASTQFVNQSSNNYASWTFRKAKKFFDVVTYTGNGTYPRDISHNLGSAPGCIIVKCTSNSSTDWFVYHRSLSVDGTNGPYRILLNSTAAQSTNDDWKNAPTSSVFTVNNSDVNLSGRTYVAYLFAHDAGGFGDAGSDNVISCGSFTCDGSGNADVTLGYEPQWLLVKPYDASGYPWYIADIMRGMPHTGDTRFLNANTSGAETGDGGVATFRPTATGFQVRSFSQANIYIAIRRGPMKTPETGTSVFETVTRNTTGADATVNAVITPVDLAISDDRNAIDGQGALWFDRLRGATKFLRSAGTNAEITASDTLTSFAVQNGYTLGADAGAYGINSSPAKAVVYWNFRRAPGFFDVVCYTGTGSATTFSHNLGVAPELMIVKRRGTANAWAVYANNDNTDYLVLNTTAATVDDNTYWNDTSPTSSVFSVGTNNATNASGSTYVAYLFASLSGVSKVGSYTGNGSSVTVTTNFQPRFILVKRTDSTGDWIVSDSARGLVAGNDPYLELNTADAEVTNEDWVDISSTSFTVNQTTNNANVNTGTYIYLAVS